MYIPKYERIYIPSCSAGCEGSTEGSLGRAMLIVVDGRPSGGPRASLFASDDDLSVPDMHSSSNVARTSLHLSHLSLDNMPTPPPVLQRSPHKAPLPVLRWFGNTNPSHSSLPSPTDSQPLSPSSDPVENLLDALTSPLPALSTPNLKRPSRAVPPNMPLWGSPSHLLGLSRVTLPTASLSNLIPATRPFDPSDNSQSPGAPIYLQHSPPERSSLDALRSLRNRQSASSARLSRSTSLASLPSLPSLFSTSATPSWWRFQNDSKEDIDRLLSEEDRAPTVEEERSRIHKKCAWFIFRYLRCFPKFTSLA
jgi:triacylglycerol lipase